MKKILLVVTLLLVLICIMSSCSHQHQWCCWHPSGEVTCTQDSTKERICLCGEKETQTFPALGHDFYDWNTIQEATCTVDGYRERTCAACGEKETNTIVASHTWRDATCTKAKNCRKCGLYDGEPLGHTCSTGRCGRCNTEIYPKVNLTSAPLILWTEDTGNSLEITELSYQFKSGKLVIYFSGKANIGKYDRVGMYVQIFDDNGFQVYDRGWITYSLKDGVKFKESIEVFSLYPFDSSEYTVIISDLD